MSEIAQQASLAAVLRAAETDPSGLSDADYAALLNADGAELDALCALADALRAETVGDELTYVVNRNLDTGVVGGAGEASRARLVALVEEAAALGATEICLQGPLPANAPEDGYRELVRTIAAAAPGLHLHAFRPAEVADGAVRVGLSPREFLESLREAGLGSVPGTAARILDDDVRAALTGGTDIPVARWIELISTAHEVGLRSTATMVYGHIETPWQQVAHLRTLAAIQDRTGGFTEFIAMPYVPGVTGPDLASVAQLKGVAAGSQARPSARESRAVHAVARLMLHGRVDHIQTAWTKLGMDLTRHLLRGGADDIGGLLLDGSLDPSAGAEQGRQLGVADVARVADELGRRPRQRSTLYGEVGALPCR